MALQKYFYVFKDPEDSSSYLIYVDDFYNYFVKQAKKENIHIRRSYILRTFKTVKVIEGKEAVQIKDILRYCFNHVEEYSVCKEIVREVEKAILFGKATSEHEYVRSSLELYKLIAKNKFEISNALSEQVSLDYSTVETLVKDHKSQFSDHEWRKIVWFEYHFSREHSCEKQSYEDLLKLKWDKYSNLQSFKNLKGVLEDVTRKHLKHRILRREATKQSESAQIFGAYNHRYDVIDSELTALIQEYYPEEFRSVTIFEEDHGKHESEIVAVIEVSSHVGEEVYGYVKQSISYELQRKHGLALHKLVSVQTELIQKYKNKDGDVARFRLRDDILLGKLTLYGVYFENVDVSQTALASDTDKCDGCFNMNLIKPLSKRDFCVYAEWHLDIPVELQMILSVFVNTEALGRAQNPDKFLKTKLEKLYTVYDSLLNIMNKNYVGIFQQANTDELLYDYRNIKSVFSITSASGATTSHSKAEEDWKKRADDDTLYFNTYLKPQPLTYCTDAGLATKHTSLRKCHIILMLDNLVRLQFSRDPRRGETPSSQLCTLPITLQGLPLDTAITEKWHDMQQCDGSFNCQCKKRISLQKEDIEKVLLAPSEAEKLTYQNFTNLCSWGYQEIWQKMPGKLHTCIFLQSLPPPPP